MFWSSAKNSKNSIQITASSAAASAATMTISNSGGGGGTYSTSNMSNSAYGSSNMVLTAGGWTTHTATGFATSHNLSSANIQISGDIHLTNPQAIIKTQKNQYEKVSSNSIFFHFIY